jgi:hypothetical protein
VLVSLTAVAVGGCATTQQEAARLQLNDARIRAAEKPTRVSVAGGTVQVTRVTLVRAGEGDAFIVQVRNPGSRAITDLPISVGVRAGRKELPFLNAVSPLEYSYFDAHLPAVQAGGSLTWVYTTNRPLPAHARPFALVGGVPSTAVPRWTGMPAIRASVVAAPLRAGTGAGRVSLSVDNLSSIPQYQLQVYAVAREGARQTAAGSLTVTYLGSNTSTRLTLPLLGRDEHARLQVEALPTTFQ